MSRAFYNTNSTTVTVKVKAKKDGSVSPDPTTPGRFLCEDFNTKSNTNKCNGVGETDGVACADASITELRWTPQNAQTELRGVSFVLPSSTAAGPCTNGGATGQPQSDGDDFVCELGGPPSSVAPKQPAILGYDILVANENSPNGSCTIDPYFIRSGG